MTVDVKVIIKFVSKFNIRVFCASVNFTQKLHKQLLTIVSKKLIVIIQLMTYDPVSQHHSD